MFDPILKEMKSLTPEKHHLIDLSHTILDGMITYKGLPAPIICDYWSREYSRQFYAGNTKFHIGKIEMVANTGTYLDSPFHRFQEGKDISQLNLSSLANLEGVVVRVPNNVNRMITQKTFSGLDLNGKAVLINTNWDQYWLTDEYFVGHPYLAKDAAEYLVESGVVMVGIDSLNIDDTSDGFRPVHTKLLGENIPIVEHLCNLGELPNEGFKFFAVPVKVKNLGSFPVRAFAIVDQGEDRIVNG